MSNEARHAELREIATTAKKYLKKVEGLPEDQREKFLEHCLKKMKKLLAKGETLDQFLNE